MIGRYLLLEEKLTGEYADAFQKVKFYTVIHELNEEICDEMMMDLLDMLLSAQEEGQPAGSIVGEDIEAFCQDYFDGREPKWRIWEWLGGINRLCWLSAILEFLFLRDSEVVTMQTQTDILPYLVGFLGADILCRLIAFAFKKFFFKKTTTGTYLLSLLAAFALFVAAAGFLPETICLYVPLWLFYLVIAAYIIIYKAVQLGMRYRRTGSFFRKPSEYQITFGSAVKEQVEEEYAKEGSRELMLAKEFVKQYEKMNKKKEKRGHAPLSEEQFHQKIVKNNRNSGRALMEGTLLGIAAGWVLVSAMGGYSLHIVDIIIFLLLEGAAFSLLKFAMKKTTDPTAKLLKLCEKEGITVLEYARKDGEVDKDDTKAAEE